MKSELISIRPDARVKSNGCSGTLEREEWRPIKGYEGLYEVSSFGRVRSLDRVEVWKGTTRPRKGRIMTPQINICGYKRVGLHNKGNKKMCAVHRLVMEAFVPNPDNLPQVNHRNEVKTANYPDNMEWCDAKYNINYGTGTSRRIISNIGRTHTNEAKSKIRKSKECVMLAVKQFTKDGIFIREFESAREAERKTRICHSHISRNCKGIYQSAGGFVWRYKE